MVNTPEQRWEIGSGPEGRGDCLFRPIEGGTVVIVPRGVPIEPGTTPVSELMQWRLGFFDKTEGSISSEHVAVLGLEDVLQQARGSEDWVLAQEAQFQSHEAEARA